MVPQEGTKQIIEEQKPSIADMVNARFGPLLFHLSTTLIVPERIGFCIELVAKSRSSIENRRRKRKIEDRYMRKFVIFVKENRFSL